MKGQKGFFFNQSRCSGCLTCILACRQWHSADGEAVHWRQVETIETGAFPHLSVTFLSYSCYHCEAPPCVAQCPASAITKRARDGVVLTDPSLCLGEGACGCCKEACPYGIPAFGNDPDRKMEKCDLCYERMEGGKRPICVEACPMRALDAGDLEELKKKYGEGREAEGFHDSLEIRPSIVLRRK